MEAAASDEMIVLLVGRDATRLQGRGFLCRRENNYGDEGRQEVHDEDIIEEEQREEVEFLAQVQSIGR